MERTAFSSLAGYTLPLYFFPSLSYAPLKLAYSHAPDRFHRETVHDNAYNSYAHRSSPPFYPLDLGRNCFFGFSNLSVFAWCVTRFEKSELERHSWGKSWMIVNIFNFLPGIPTDVEN